MDRVLFSEMKVGEVYNAILLLGTFIQKTSKLGNPYVEMILSDGNKNIIARKFDSTVNDVIATGVNEDSLVQASIKIIEYNGAKSYNICNIAPVYGSHFTIDDFIPKTPIDIGYMYSGLVEAIDASHTSSLRDYDYMPITELTKRILERNREVFCRSSAAKILHHNMVGGLLMHTYAMVRIIPEIIEVYPTLDQELLVCGVALHDIGKVRELRTSATGAADYTEEGRLLGHAAIGIMMIEEESKKDVYEDERVRLLQHMLAAHHGNPECGAIVRPAIPEATVLHALDMIDSRMYMFGTAYEEVAAGHLSGNIFGLDNSSVYKALPALTPEDFDPRYWKPERCKVDDKIGHFYADDLCESIINNEEDSFNSSHDESGSREKDVW